MKFVGFYNDLPPTANNMYFNRSGGGRGLTTLARNYKTRMTGWLIGELLPYATQFVGNIPYAVRILLVMPRDQVVNKTFGAVCSRGPRKGLHKKGAAVTRFKKTDVDNRAKLLLDALSSALGVDDSCNFSVTIMKCIGDDPGVWLSVEPFAMEPDDTDVFISML